LGTNTTASGAKSFGPLSWSTYDEHWLADDRGMRGGSRCATEVHAFVAMPIIVHAIAQAVR
jgi:hypothetical protein